MNSEQLQFKIANNNFGYNNDGGKTQGNDEEDDELARPTTPVGTEVLNGLEIGSWKVLKIP